MKLHYHRGANFGDAINPIIFNHYLGTYLDDNDDQIILGIGSILGLFKKPDNCKKIYVFSAGFGGGDESTYGKSFNLTENIFDVICVRGKSTAKAFGLAPEIGIADGAILLPLVTPMTNKSLVYDYSYMPHVGSLDMYDQWQDLIESIGIHFIDPRNSPDFILEELSKTGTLLTEAMHGAIICDAYRIPWIPIKTVKTINDFKWNDYLETMDQKYDPIHIKTLYSLTFLKNLFKVKLKKMSFISNMVARLYFSYQKLIVIPSVKKMFLASTKSQANLAKQGVLEQKQEKLLLKMEELKMKIAN